MARLPVSHYFSHIVLPTVTWYIRSFFTQITDRICRLTKKDEKSLNYLLQSRSIETIFISVLTPVKQSL